MCTGQRCAQELEEDGEDIARHSTAKVEPPFATLQKFWPLDDMARQSLNRVHNARAECSDGRTYARSSRHHLQIRSLRGRGCCSDVASSGHFPAVLKPRAGLVCSLFLGR